MKTLSKSQIINIRNRARTRFDKQGLKIARNQFHNIYAVLLQKEQLSDWTVQDLKDVLAAFNIGCSAATHSTCSVIRKEYFREIKGEEFEYEDYEFCRPCFFKNFCSGNPNNRVEDGWHYNMTLLRDHLVSAKSKSDIDKQYVKQRIQKIKASNDLQDLHDLVENWEANQWQ